MEKDVPYIVFESEMARLERHNKRTWIFCIILIIALIVTNAGWIYYEQQFEEVVTTTYRSDATDGGNAVINGEGEVTINGESDQSSH